MYRRRRPPAREPVFSFDSFLDVVANVSGIIIRLILVAWVGARTYGSLTARDMDEPTAAEPPALKSSDHPLCPQIAETELELAKTRRHLLDQLKDLKGIEAKKDQTNRVWSLLLADRREFERQRADLEQKPPSQNEGSTQAELTLAELRER